MVENILQFLLVIAVSFGVLVVLTSYFRFQNRVASAAALDEAEAVGEEPFMDRLAGHLASGPRDPDPCLVVRVELEARDAAVVGGLSEPDRVALQRFMAEHLRRRVRGKDAIVCLAPGRYGLLVLAGIDQADVVVQRLAGAFEDDVFHPRTGEGLPLHVRVGAAACPADGTGVDGLLAASAKALEATGPGSPWALASPGARAQEDLDAKADPLADVPAAQQHLVDPVTGVLKEDHLGSTMQRFVARARNRGRSASIGCLEIVQFDRYRDLYGTAGADALLAHLARILKHRVREEDLLARYGAGRFVVMLGCESDRARRAVERIGRDVQDHPLGLQGTEVTLKVAAGVAGCPEHGTVPSDIFKLALTALSYAGQEGQGPIVVYQEGMAARQAQPASRESF